MESNLPPKKRKVALFVIVGDNDILKKFSELKTNQPRIINPGQSVKSKGQSFIEATYEKRKKDEEVIRD